MPKVSLHTPAPNFALQNFEGEIVSLADFRQRMNVLLVFNRGFA